MNHLPALLATLLPGDPPWPSGAVLAETVAADLAATPDGTAALDRLLASLPPDFAAGDEATLQAIEKQMPADFERILSVAYIAYYTDPEVRLVLESVTGYAARPPQPLGYELPPFDNDLLARQRTRVPFWRDPDAAQ
jgi:hypothetical protein